MSQNSHMLDTPIEFLKGVGPQRAEVLQKELHIFSYRDLLELYPFRYIDKTQFYKINQLKDDLADVLCQLQAFKILAYIDKAF